ncbi:hypothetical protein CMI47_19765 [Candidatus Pacearchaeota archaeon]|nr:hypothetical protein [Candidatus Pacearchaeota archaeon]|tara:strand:- start:1041 stop:1259 length:219 start_codon:yes stop_codon:yes gene_type:complete
MADSLYDVVLPDPVNMLADSLRTLISGFASKQGAVDLGVLGETVFDRAAALYYRDTVLFVAKDPKETSMVSS